MDIPKSNPVTSNTSGQIGSGAISNSMDGIKKKPPVIDRNKPPVISENGNNQQNGVQGIMNSASANTQNEEKLSTVVWILLALGAGMLDLTQIGLELLVVGIVLNLLIDIFVGLSLGTFFLIKGMLDWKTGISIFLGFAVDFISDGILPAWILDIGVVWLMTDGAGKLGNIPIIGEAARKATLMALQKGKGGGVPPVIK